MPQTSSKLQRLYDLHARFGAAKILKHVGFRLVNRILRFDCVHVIVLDREHLQPLEPGNPHCLSVRDATLEDLREMERQGDWDIDRSKIERFQAGNVCVLSYVGDQLAGYTWVHSAGSHEIAPGFWMSVPHEYLYNFAGFTLPAYRGCGLQSFRHHALLNDPRWRCMKGLLGWVNHTNYRSQRGQGKGGYRTLGDIWLLGTKSAFYAHVNKNLRAMGIKRIGSAGG